MDDKTLIEKSAEWFDNKALFLMIQNLSTEMKLTTQEMSRTREIVAKYNGLREEIGQVKIEIAAIQEQASGRSSVGQGIRDWGGWIAGIIGVGLAVASFIVR